MSKSTKKLRARKNPRRKQSQLNSALSGSHGTVNQPLFDSVRCRLKWLNPTWVYDTSLLAYWSKEYQMNSAYDVDPLVGGGTCLGFNEWASMYTRYRVLRFNYEVEFVNQSSSTLIVSVCPTKTSYGSNYSHCIDFSEAPYGQSRMLSPKGGMDRAVLRGSIDLVKFSGYHGYLFDDVSSGLVTGNPSQLYYLQIGVNSNVTGAVFSVRMKFYLDTQFFQTKPVFVD